MHHEQLRRYSVNILAFIPLLHLLSEGGMSPLPVRKDSGGKVVAVCLHNGC